MRVSALELSWQSGRPNRFELPQGKAIAPGSAWTVLDPYSYAELSRQARQQGLRSFGVGDTVHDLTVRLDHPGGQRLTFQVSWGFATPEYDMGFFLPALEDE